MSLGPKCKDGLSLKRSAARSSRQKNKTCRASVARGHDAFHLVPDTSSYAGEHQKMDRNNFLPRQTVGFPFKLNLLKGSSAFSLHHGAFQIAISFCFSSTKEPSLFLSGHLRSTEKSNHGQIPQNSWAWRFHPPSRPPKWPFK